VRGPSSADHIGIVQQKQPGLSYVGLVVPTGRIRVDQLFELAHLAETYGTGEIRLTTSQNVIIVNVPNGRLRELLAEPLLRELSPDPSGVMRGLVSCTGIDYCHLALIETKELALETARQLESFLPRGQGLTMHWSGCPAGCGNHAAADIGLLGKNIRVNGEIVDAVDVFVGGSSGPNGKAGTRLLEDVPCEELPFVLERMVPYLSRKRSAGAAQRSVSTAEPALSVHVSP
jgi:ferredoxin-nitrite reductase